MAIQVKSEKQLQHNKFPQCKVKKPVGTQHMKDASKLPDPNPSQLLQV